MADLEKIVKIIFAGDDTGISSAIDSVGKGLKSLETVSYTHLTLPTTPYV